MRLTLVIASLGRGGAERTASVLASAWAEKGIHVTLITYLRDDVPAYPLHAGVVLRQLHLRGGAARHFFHGLVRNLKVVRALRRAIRESAPDLIVSFMDIPNVLTLLAARGINAPVVVTEHTHPAYYDIGWMWQILRRLVYDRADALVCMTTPVLSWFQQRFKIRGFIIPNSVDPPPSHVDKLLKRDMTKSFVIAMGRLSWEKGFDLLLDAFSRIAVRHPNWSLRILGEGPLRQSLEEQVQNLNLNGRVELTGALEDPFPVLQAADIFVFSSRFEGFGNALCEAMACGLPVISFSCPSGPPEIIRDGIDGLLVPPENTSALATAMDRLMCSAHERILLAARAPEVVSRFSRQRIMGLWDQLFAEVMAKRENQDLHQ